MIFLSRPIVLYALYWCMFSDFRPLLRPVFSPCCYPCILTYSFPTIVLIIRMSFPKIQSSTSFRPLGGEREGARLTPLEGSLRGVVTAPLSCNLSARLVLCGPSGVGGVRDGAPGEYTRVYRIESWPQWIRTSQRRIPGKWLRPGAGVAGGISRRAVEDASLSHKEDFFPPRPVIRYRGRVNHKVCTSSPPPAPPPRSNPSIWETKTKFKGSTEVASRTLIHGSCGACQTAGRTGPRLRPEQGHISSFDLFQLSLFLSLSLPSIL